MLLCIGTTPTVQRTLTFDKLTLDEVNRSAVTDEYASGKSVNVARVATLLGADVVATGFAGGDRGAFLRQQLSADGVKHDFQRVEPQTRLCTTVIDRAGGTVTELVEEHAIVGDVDWVKLYRKCVKHIHRGGADVVVLSGSLPPQPDEAFYPDVLEYAAIVKKPVIIDTRGKPLRACLETDYPFVAKLNRAELAETVGEDLKTDAALRKAMRAVMPPGGSIVVTMGKDGAAAWDGSDYWRIGTPTVDAVNPIGSGDAFAAGLAVATERKLKPEKAFALAAACGAANALHPRAGCIKPSDVRRLAKLVRVEHWG